jgi:hypothetical protein
MSLFEVVTAEIVASRGSESIWTYPVWENHTEQTSTSTILKNGYNQWIAHNL